MNSWTVVACWLYEILTISHGKFNVVNSTTLNPRSETKNLTDCNPEALTFLKPECGYCVFLLFFLR